MHKEILPPPVLLDVSLGSVFVTALEANLN